ncbi:MAG TPA: hypothetical protein VMW72_11855 [Sedimentisphaerales bacterium]|nr:hypothetical protein [Sedimentisphaerales bacterium]
MYHGKIQIAICQLECHPALRVSDIDFLCEPFIPRSTTDMSLSKAARASLDVADLQGLCKEEYLKWHSKRLKTILDFLANEEEPPDIVVFPEGAIPDVMLQDIRDTAIKAQMTIFAGTHTLRLTRDWQRRYKRLGLDTRTKKVWEKNLSHGDSLLPIFHRNKSFFRRKSSPSIFEFTDGQLPQATVPGIEILTLQEENGDLNVLPLICSEALQRHSEKDDFQIAAICAYDRNPRGFDHLISHYVDNQKVVALANDGFFGGSGVFLPVDKRISAWWWSETVRGRLPEGDGIITIEVDLDAVAPQVGVANPKIGGALKVLSAVTYEYNPNAGFIASEQIAELKKTKDNTIQAEVIGQLLERDLPVIQRIKLGHLHRLAKNQTADENAWAVFGRDCQVASSGGLRQLQEKLAKTCADRLTEIINVGEIEDEAILGRISRYIGTCRKRGPANQKALSNTSTRLARVSAIVGRQDEIRDLISFLNDESLVIYQISGINAVGKTSVVQTAIEQSGYQNVFSIKLVKASTPGFIWASLIAQLGYAPHEARAFSIEKVRPLLADRLPHNSVLVIENAHHCLEHHTWRDARFPELFKGLSELVSEFNCKLVIETAVEIHLDFVPTNTWKLYRLGGLKNTEAVNLLTQQLRRVGLNPQHYSTQQCLEVVKKLGAHPGAIILASEYIEQSTMSKVLGDIQKRKGSYLEIVRRIIKELYLTEEESLAIALLSLARRPVPAQVVVQAAKFDDLAVFRDLYQSALIERYENDHIMVAELLRNFADLPPLNPDQERDFHEAATKAFASLATKADSVQQIEWAVESKYHALACGKPSLASQVIELIDGSLAAAKELAQRKEYEEAKTIIEGVLKVDREAETLELAAQIYANLGECDSALSLAKEVTREPGEGSWIFTEVGRCALYFNRTDVAKSAVALAKVRGISTYAFILEGKIHLKEQHPNEAINAFRNGVNISQRDGWPHFYLGRELLRKGAIDKAIEVLEEGEQIEHQRWKPRRNVLVAIRTQLGNAHLLNGDIEKAENWLKLIAEDPSPEAARAFAYIRIKANKGVVTKSSLVDLDPKKAKNRFEKCQIYLFRGIFYLTAGMPAEASEEFRRASQADPRNLFVLLRWSQALVEIARDSQSEREPETAHECAEQAKTLAIKVLELDQMNEEALKILEKLYDEFNIS